MDDYKAKFGSRYRARWLEDRSGSDDVVKTLQNLKTSGQSMSQSAALKNGLAFLSNLGVHVENPMEFTKLLPRDDYEDSLEIMSQVRAYFHGAHSNLHRIIMYSEQDLSVSSKRFIDNVPLAVDRDLVRAIGRDVQRALYDALMSGNARDRCSLYLQEHQSTSAVRMELTAKLQRLKQAKQEMLSV